MRWQHRLTNPLPLAAGEIVVSILLPLEWLKEPQILAFSPMSPERLCTPKAVVPASDRSQLCNFHSRSPAFLRGPPPIRVAGFPPRGSLYFYTFPTPTSFHAFSVEFILI